MKSPLFSFWHFDFIVTLFIIALCGLYFYAINFRLKKQALYFFSGIFLIILCVASPLHFLGENYLFSAHMLSHVLIILIAAPLIVAGIPQENKFKKPLQFFSKKIIKIPVISWFAGVSIMWIWHVPYIFNQLFSMNGMANSTMHSMSFLMYVHMLSLLIAGIIFCWPVINPYRRIAPLTGVLYLSTACVFCSLLGLMITFAPAGIYTQYIPLMDPYGYLPIIRNTWKISIADDQQIGGLIMWVPGCFIYLSASMLLLIKWFDEKQINGITPIDAIEIKII